MRNHRPSWDGDFFVKSVKKFGNVKKMLYLRTKKRK